MQKLDLPSCQLLSLGSLKSCRVKGVELALVKLAKKCWGFVMSIELANCRVSGGRVSGVEIALVVLAGEFLSTVYPAIL